MSKIRQAVTYERKIAKAEVQAHRELVAHDLKAARKLTSEKIRSAVAYRDKALAYERKITDQQFSNLDRTAEEHRHFHEREHLLYEDAIEKASAAIQAQLKILEAETDRMRDASNGYLTIDRFDREHRSLIEKVELSLSNLGEKVHAEETVTVRQTTKDEVLQQIAISRRWLIGIGTTTALSLIALLAHLAKLY